MGNVKLRSFALASYTMYFLGGLVITTIGSVLPQLIKHYNLSYTESGQLVFIASVGFLVGVPFSSFLMSKMSEKSLLSLAASFVAIAQLGFLLLPPISLVFVLVFVTGLGTAAFEIVVATLMMELFIGRRAVVMSYLEVSFGLGALLMPIIASILISHDMWRFSFLVTGTLAIVMMIIWKRISFSKTGEIDNSKPLDASSPPPKFRNQRTKWMVLSLFVLMIFMYGGLEGSLNNFLSSVFITYLGAVPYYASLSLGIFWTAMVVGRLATGWIIRKVTYSHFLLWSISGTIVIFILFILLKNALVAFVLIGMLGLTMSGIYSITMVYANHSLPGLTRLVTSLITGFCGLGGAVFPALIGFAMDHASVTVALWGISSFAGLFLLTLLTIFGMHLKLNKNTVVTEIA
jgi:FHS family glucose/mannose:H+ symporter-like MFS transporter